MRIAHLVGHMALNGVATSSFTLANEQVKAGHAVMLVCPEGSWLAAQSYDPRIELITSSFKAVPSEIRRVGYIIRDWNGDLAHCHGSKANKFGMVFRFASGFPAVMTAHSRKFQLPWMAAHIVIAPSQDTADFYVKRLLARRKSIRVISNMFPVEQIEPANAAARLKPRAQLGIAADAFVIGAVGHLEERKNQAAMQRLTQRLAGDGLPVRLLLIGNYPENPLPHEKPVFEGFRADPLVVLTHQRNDVADLLPAFDVFLMLSFREEGPIAPLEAMAREIPTISYLVGNMSDITPPDLLFEQGDEEGVYQCLKRLFNDPDLRLRAGSACRAKVARHLAPSVILPQIEAAYQAAIAKSSFVPPVKPVA
ncbi:MAG: glycosyltransferase family 4 protein [Rhizobiaceae bacterium]